MEVQSNLTIAPRLEAKTLDETALGSVVFIGPTFLRPGESPGFAFRCIGMTDSSYAQGVLRVTGGQLSFIEMGGKDKVLDVCERLTLVPLLGAAKTANAPPPGWLLVRPDGLALVCDVVPAHWDLLDMKTGRMARLQDTMTRAQTFIPWEVRDSEDRRIFGSSDTKPLPFPS